MLIYMYPLLATLAHSVQDNSIYINGCKICDICSSLAGIHTVPRVARWWVRFRDINYERLSEGLYICEKRKPRKECVCSSRCKSSRCASNEEISVTFMLHVQSSSFFVLKLFFLFFVFFARRGSESRDAAVVTFLQDEVRLCNDFRLRSPSFLSLFTDQ